jgi:hypothetical protein
VQRLGYGAMQLAGPGVFGPPKNPDAARAVLRTAVERGVNHIDTSDFYGAHVTNQLIREALHPYPDDLVIVTKIGARRGQDASWIPAWSAAEMTQAVHDNLRNLRLDAIAALDGIAASTGPMRCAFRALASSIRGSADGTFLSLGRCSGMPKPFPDDNSQAKRIALLKRREEQQADAPKAMAEYRAAQRAALERMHELRALRLAREAAEAQSHAAQSK